MEGLCSTRAEYSALTMTKTLTKDRTEKDQGSTTVRTRSRAPRNAVLPPSLTLAKDGAQRSLLELVPNSLVVSLSLE